MGTRERALKLLGQNVEQEVVATALGVTPGYVSQLLSEPEFAAKVAELRLITLENATDRDGKYDELEDELLEKLRDVTTYMTKPREIAAVLLGLNKAVRRGVRPENTPEVKRDTVILSFPTIIQQKFVMNEVNQVIAVGTEGQEGLKDLTTITAKNLMDQVSKLPVPRNQEVIEHGPIQREAVVEGARN